MERTVSLLAHPPCTFISLGSSPSRIRNQPPERSCYTEIKSQPSATAGRREGGRRGEEEPEEEEEEARKEKREDGTERDGKPEEEDGGAGKEER